MQVGTRVVLVRHGESRAQELGLVGGHKGCRGLSDRGRRQVEALRDRWSDGVEIGAGPLLYASIMPRAIETATILAPALGLAGPEPAITQDCAWCEHHPGEGDGLTRAEYDERFPYPESGWDPHVRRDPGSETWHEMAERVGGAFDALVEAHPGRTVVVACHGGVVIQLMVRMLGIDPGRGSDRVWLDCANASVTEFRRVPRRYAPDVGVWELARFNDHAHLTHLD